ncbi:hypothetical protein, partial [Bradyrhizobium brasilense]|uniref:hypothetical protein n=1 Tax=Bradyrhizobium brasilense TaxID=1419277 RepID=UPI001E2BCDDB
MRETSGDALEIGKHTVATLGVQASKCCGKEMIVSHRKSPPGLCSRIATAPIHRAEEPIRSFAVAHQALKVGGRS